MIIDPHILGLLCTVTGVGFAMVWLATKLNLLEQRSLHRCPACGRLRRNGSCGCS
jgi:hypothetical protein